MKQRSAKPTTYHINDSERDRIAELRSQGRSIRSIARDLRRAPSSICEEIGRGADRRGGGCVYRATLAAKRSMEGQRAPRKKIRLHENKRLLAAVFIHLVIFRWSPEQIANKLKEEYPRDMSMRISDQAIYEYVYVHASGELKHMMFLGMRRPRKGQKKRSMKPELRGTVKALSIDERPKGVESRRIPGHWESDLVVGRDHKSALITLVERKFRYVIILRMVGLDAVTFSRKVSAALRRLPMKLRKTMTHDGGKEVGLHEEITKQTGIKVFIAHPRSPWERGTNENTNGLIRDFFPKGTDFREVSDAQVLHVQNLLNSRPRKTLNWATPNEKLLQVFG